MSRTRFADYKSGKKVVAKLTHGYIPQKSYFVPKKGSFLQKVPTKIQNLDEGLTA